MKKTIRNRGGEDAKRRLLDVCPRCKKRTWHMNVYMHFTAPGRFLGNLGKTARRHRNVNCSAVLWETASWWCANSKCMHCIDPVSQVRLERKS